MSKIKFVKHYVEYLIINSSLLIGFDEKLLPMHSLVYYLVREAKIFKTRSKENVLQENNFKIYIAF